MPRNYAVTLPAIVLSYCLLEPPFPPSSYPHNCLSPIILSILAIRITHERREHPETRRYPSRGRYAYCVERGQDIDQNEHCWKVASCTRDIDLGVYQSELKANWREEEEIEPFLERSAFVAEEAEGEEHDHCCSRYNGIEGEKQGEKGRNGGQIDLRGGCVSNPSP